MTQKQSKPDVSFTLALPDGKLLFPRKPFTVPANSSFSDSELTCYRNQLELTGEGNAFVFSIFPAPNMLSLFGKALQGRPDGIHRPKRLALRGR
jgi:hypothetical protein